MRDRDLVRLHWPPALRPAFDALFALDDRLAEVALGATQPALGAIKLAWWRDQLAALDTQPPPPEPLLVAASSELLPLGLSGADLSNLAEAWSLLLLEPEPGVDGKFRSMGERGPLLFRLAARLLDRGDAGEWADQGCEYATADLARRGQFDLARSRLGRLPRQQARFRPLTLLWALARRDQQRGGPPFEPEATPGRSWTLLRHRFTGR